ncbi:MAG: cytochrome c [Bdellovibrionota bacterium]
MIKALLVAILLFVFSTLAFGGAPQSSPELLAKGKAVYTINCLPCHGENGDGNGPAGAVMNPKPRNFNIDKFKGGEKPEQIFKTITSGLPNTSMATFGHLPEEDRWALVYHILSYRKNAASKVGVKKKK